MSSRYLWSTRRSSVCRMAGVTLSGWRMSSSPSIVTGREGHFEHRNDDLVPKPLHGIDVGAVLVRFIACGRRLGVALNAGAGRDRDVSHGGSGDLRADRTSIHVEHHLLVGNVSTPHRLLSREGGLLTHGNRGRLTKGRPRFLPTKGGSTAYQAFLMRCIPSASVHNARLIPTLWIGAENGTPIDFRHAIEFAWGKDP